MSNMLDYHSVIRVLLRHGCELKWILDLLLHGVIYFYFGWLFTSKEELDFKKLADSEKEAHAEAEHALVNHATQRYKVILKRPPNTLLHWLSFLSDQGFEVNNIDDEGFTPLIYKILAIIQRNPNSPSGPRATLVVLALCLLKADVSIREPRFGLQALHLLCSSSRDVVGTSNFSDLAYVLIRYGGADVHATTCDGANPLYYAWSSGWLDEWFMVLRRCRISLFEYCTKERQCLDRFRYLGNGDSTAIHINGLRRKEFETVTKRKPFIGDRLGE